MTSTSLDISKRLSSSVTEALWTLKAEAERVGADLLLVGATAREIHFLESGITGRATADVDIGIILSDWRLYENFIQRLIAGGSFTADKKRYQRLKYQETLPVDIIPFGGIETDDGVIHWPSEDAGTMRVTGFKDVWEHALSAHIGRGKKIRLASLPGMAILKIIAWNERNKELPTKDAEDLALILYNYAAAGNSNRLYDEYPDFITALEGDLELAGARLLGLDMAAIMCRKTKEVVLEILARNTLPEKADKLVEAVFRHLHGSNYERAVMLFQNITQGMQR